MKSWVILIVFFSVLSKPVHSQPILKNMIVQDIQHKDQFVVVTYKDMNSEKSEAQVIVHIDQHTRVSSSNKEQLGNIDCLKKGMEVHIVTNGILTRSTPSQTLGLHFIIVRESLKELSNVS